MLGNLFEQDLPAIWNGERYLELRRALVARRPDSIAACRGCDMPHDDSKFSLRNMAKTAVHRALLLDRA